MNFLRRRSNNCIITLPIIAKVGGSYAKSRLSQRQRQNSMHRNYIDTHYVRGALFAGWPLCERYLVTNTYSINFYSPLLGTISRFSALYLLYTNKHTSFRYKYNMCCGPTRVIVSHVKNKRSYFVLPILTRKRSAKSLLYDAIIDHSDRRPKRFSFANFGKNILRV